MPLPTWVDEESELKRLQTKVVDDLYRHETTGMLRHAKLRMNARGDEDRAAFTARVRAEVTEKVNDELAALHAKVQKKVDRLEDQLERARGRVLELKGVASSKQTEELVDFGASIFSIFAGKGRVTGSKVSRAVRKRGQTSRANQRVSSAEEKVEALEEDLADLQLELEEQSDALQQGIEEAVEAIEEKEVRLEKSDIRVDRFGVLWIPVTP